MYLDNPTTVNPDSIVPVPRTMVPEGELTLPSFHDRVKSLGQTVSVDSFLPGCPPEGQQVEMVVDTLLKGFEPDKLPQVLGAGEKALCEECPLTRNGTHISRFYRPQDIIPKPDICLLEQGLLCMGPATRSGCGAKCLRHNMACLGCYDGAVSCATDTVDGCTADCSNLSAGAIDGPNGCQCIDCVNTTCDAAFDACAGFPQGLPNGTPNPHPGAIGGPPICEGIPTPDCDN